MAMIDHRVMTSSSRIEPHFTARTQLRKPRIAMQLMAERVMPHVNAAIKAAVAA
jgi:hypothetical protein